MNHFAETLTPEERRRGRLYAYFSCYFGCISEVMMDSSAIIILYIGMLGGGEMLTMLSTGVSNLIIMLFMIPAAALINRIGLKRAVPVACLTGCAGFLLMAAAPWFGPWRQAAVLIGCLIYALQRSLFGAAWYPMLDAFLRPQDRGSFFGTMRYSYMLLSGGLFFVLGKVMGKHPPLWLMQSVIGVTGILLLGRLYCMMHFPDDPMERPVKLKIRTAFGISLRNRALTCYSVYVCLLSLACTSLVPLPLLYLKESVGLEAGTVQIFSTVGIAGGIAGFFCYGILAKRIKLKMLELIVHLIFMGAGLALFLLPGDLPGFLWIAGAIYFLTLFASSTFLCNNSVELLALARPGNKPMAVAFQQTYQNLGVSGGRTAVALILGGNLLAPQWMLGKLVISNYQTLFLLCGALATILLVLLPTLPAAMTKHHDYYDPMR